MSQHGLSAFQLTMLTLGFEIIGLAASEASDPHKTVPGAIRARVISLVGLYIAVIALA